MILETSSQQSLTVNVPIRVTPNLSHDPDLLIDIKDFMPVLVSSSDRSDVRIHSSFSLANMDRDAGERLHALVGFIQTSQKASGKRQYVGCTQAVGEQIAYLAYWKDYPLEFCIGRSGNSIVVMAHSPNSLNLIASWLFSLIGESCTPVYRSGSNVSAVWFKNMP